MLQQYMYHRYEVYFVPCYAEGLIIAGKLKDRMNMLELIAAM